MSVFTLEALLALLGLFVLLLEAFVPSVSSRTLAGICISGVAAVLVLLVTSAGGQEALPAFVGAYHQLDTLAMFYKAFALVITLLVLWLTLEASPYLKKFTLDGKLGEMFSLPLFVCVGMMWMASARDLVTVFVSLELVTVSFYVLVAFTRKSALGLEAGVKYLILGALSTGVLVFGIAWVYGATGELSFEGIAKAVQGGGVNKTALLFGAAFLLSGLGFKVAAVPFQMWVPDVYQGASTPTTVFLSVGSKAAGFAVLTRVVEALTAPGSVVGQEVVTVLGLAGALSVVVGSLPALFQTNVKRLLAYSSISHAGFLLLALAARDNTRIDLAPGGTVAFYLATYLPMTVLGFAALIQMRLNGRGEELDDFKGLARKSPLLALMVSVAFASLAGLPLTAGFFGKMWVVVGLVDQRLWFSLACAVIGAAAGFYYYFRVILVMFTPEESTETVRMGFSAKIVCGALGLVILVLGVFPKPLQRLLSTEPRAAGVISGHHLK
jgi:NADH-quinone oxidoreductase subunit N